MDRSSRAIWHLAIDGRACNLAACNGLKCACDLAACNGRNCVQCGCLRWMELLALWLRTMDKAALKLLAVDRVLLSIWHLGVDVWNFLQFGCLWWAETLAIRLLAKDGIAWNLVPCNGQGYMQFRCLRWTEHCPFACWRLAELLAMWLLARGETARNVAVLAMDGVLLVMNRIVCNLAAAMDGPAGNLASCAGRDSLQYVCLRWAELLAMYGAACNGAACNGQSCLRCGCCNERNCVCFGGLQWTGMRAIWLLALEGMACNMLVGIVKKAYNACGCLGWVELLAIWLAMRLLRWMELRAIWPLVMDRNDFNLESSH